MVRFNASTFRYFPSESYLIYCFFLLILSSFPSNVDFQFLSLSFTFFSILFIKTIPKHHKLWCIILCFHFYIIYYDRKQITPQNNTYARLFLLSNPRFFYLQTNTHTYVHIYVFLYDYDSICMLTKTIKY